MVTFAAKVSTEKNGTNIYTAKTAQVRKIALLQVRKTAEALDVRTRCEYAAATLTQSNRQHLYAHKSCHSQKCSEDI